MDEIFGIWNRDILRFFRDRARLLGSFAMPFLFLIIFGSGMSGAIKSLLGGSNSTSPLVNFDYVKFMFPGIIGMAVFTTSIFSALSVVQDKEFGYMREILVSPVKRSSIAIGKVLGGTTIAIIQGLFMFIFIPFIGIKINLLIIIKLIPAMFLVAFTLSSIGLLIASSIKSSSGFQMIVQLLIFPMLLLSGAFFPLSGMSSWIKLFVTINPLTYSINIFKKIILEADKLNPMLREAMGLNLYVFGHQVTIFDEVIFILIFGIIFVILATIKFSLSN